MTESVARDAENDVAIGTAGTWGNAVVVRGTECEAETGVGWGSVDVSRGTGSEAAAAGGK